MRTIRFSELISQSYDRTKLVLFQPFSLKKWLVLAFIAIFAGVGTGGRGLNYGRNFAGKGKAETQTQSQQTTTASVSPKSGNTVPAKAEPIGKSFPSRVEEKVTTPTSAPQRPIENPFANMSKRTIAAIGVGLFSLIILLAIFFGWLGARFRFVWLHSLVQNTFCIREPWEHYKAQGHSLFKVGLLLDASALSILTVVGYCGYTYLKSLGALSAGFQWQMPLILGLVSALAAILIPLLVLGALIGWVVSDVVTPLMYKDQTTFLPAWEKGWGIFRANFWDFMKFSIVGLGMGMLSGIVAMIVSLVAVLALLLTGGLVFGLLYLLTMVLIKAQMVFTVFLILLGIPFTLLAILLLACVGLPFTVFGAYLPLYYLSSLGPESQVMG